MDIIKKLIDDLDIEFPLNDKLYECIVYYTHQIKTKENKVKYCYEKEVTSDKN